MSNRGTADLLGMSEDLVMLWSAFHPSWSSLQNS